MHTRIFIASSLTRRIDIIYSAAIDLRMKMMPNRIRFATLSEYRQQSMLINDTSKVELNEHINLISTCTMFHDVGHDRRCNIIPVIHGNRYDA
jgi:hypothetical protein